MTIKVNVAYFGILSEQRGLSEEVVETTYSKAPELYHCLARQHNFTLAISQVQFAVNDKLGNQTLKDGDRVDFLPPFVGG